MTCRCAFLNLFLFSALFGADAASSRVVEDLHKLPLAFEKNQGQASSAVEYVARGAGYSVALTHANARISLRRDKDTATAMVDLRLMGARIDPQPGPRKALP